ncbi:MAG: MarR family transcriptional regulator [Thermoleophilia bacterium]
MRTEAPLLLPIFRSEGQGRLLARVYLAPDRPASLTGLARELGLDPGGVTREADRLERAGLIRSERIGGVRLLRPDEDSPYHRGLHDLLLKAFGPAVVIGPALGTVTGIEEAFVFGSWAARYLGEAGDPPRDIDVMVVGRPDRLAVSRALRPIEGELGREVNETIVSRERWEEAGDGFLRGVRAGPLVPIDLGAGGAPPDG